MVTALLKFGGVLALFIVAGAYINTPIWLSAGLGTLVAVAITFARWWQNQTRTHTKKQLTAKPFEGKLPLEIGMATTTAVALEGADEYRQTVVGCNHYSENFEDLRKYAQVADGTLLELQAALVAEPANRDSSHAVAVTAGGVVLGYIPEFESESLYVFLMQHRGIGRVNANIQIAVGADANSVQLDLKRPYRVVPGV